MGEHDYYSTACRHRMHDECRKVCKFCPAACGCDCHLDAERRSEATHPNDPFVCPTCRAAVPRRRFDSLGRHPRSGEATLCEGFAEDLRPLGLSRVDPYDTKKGYTP